MIVSADGKLNIGRLLSGMLVVFSVLAGASAPLLESNSRNAVWAHSAAILGYAVLERLANRRLPGRSISLLRITLYMAASQPVFLVLSLFIQGDANYATQRGWFSHSDGAELVAVAGIIFHAAALCGAAVVGQARASRPRGLPTIGDSYSKPFYSAMNWMALVYAAVRLILLFYWREIPLEATYALRIFVGLFIAVYIFVGMALRLRIRTAKLAFGVTLAASAVVLLAGSRSEALYPLFFMALGYMAARPTNVGQIGRWAGVVVPVFVFSMFIGSLVRQDERGRTGEAVLGRVADISSVMDHGKEERFISDSVVRRMVSDSTHSVITRIPYERPFEDGGLIQIPEEFLDRVVPRLNLDGTSDTEVPRHWMLNDLGFRVSWATSVELGLVADAWYRGGFLGLVVAGLLLGVSFQILEDTIYWSMRRRPEVSVLLLFSASSLLFVEARDVVAALRGVLFTSVAGLAMVSIAIILKARRRSHSPPTVPRPPRPVPA